MWVLETESRSKNQSVRASTSPQPQGSPTFFWGWVWVVVCARLGEWLTEAWELGVMRSDTMQVRGRSNGRMGGS